MSLLTRVIYWILTAFSLTLAAPAHYTGCNEAGGSSAVVDTSSGKFRPLLDPDYPDVSQYLGIPFAAPPLGDLRFASPQPPIKRSNVTNADKYSPSCWQFIPPVQNSFSVYEPGFNFNGTQDEDCLTLAISTPRARSQKALPVVIFVYGGGFVQGGANITFQKSPGWVQAKKDVVVVNIQYRLEIFGFPNSAALNEQNVGLQDIRFAIEWIRDNIAGFGGDPNRMILWGQSAGSVATDIYPYSSRADPIVKGTISSSGSAFAPPTWKSFDATQSNFTSIANRLGCTGDAQQLLACMRTIPASRLNTIAHQYEGNTTFLPIADQKLVFANYTQQLLHGEVARLPAVIGTNRHEAERLLDRDTSPSGPNQTQVAEDTIGTFVCPAALEASLRREAGIPTYRYEYSGNFTNLSPLPWMGAYHGSHIPLLFGTSGSWEGHPYNGNSTTRELALASHMQDLWRAFAYDPQSLPDYAWPLNSVCSANGEENAVIMFPGSDNTLSSIESGAVGEQSCSKE